ncbi:MAG: metal ABC transporter solute-binding protein, Zn/Mn family, partial [Actinomycetota bacterium]
MAENRPVIVVTYSALGDIVSQLVGDNATVTVVIPDGQDPHDFLPSAKDVETMNNATLVVSNGLEFEEGLEEVIENIA